MTSAVGHVGDIGLGYSFTPGPGKPTHGDEMTATMYFEAMGKLPEKSVDLILTSPPFWSLRSYLPADHESKALEGGSEATPGEYVDWLIDVVEACDRVLAPHGSLCVELGDTYSGGWIGDSTPIDDRLNSAGGPRIQDRRRTTHIKRNKLRESNLRGGALPKSLSLIPELFRLTLVYGVNPLTGRQTERWRLRNVVRWVRPNPPVGALGDKFRPATSELMVFCKSAKRYFDLDAVREPSITGDRAMFQGGRRTASVIPNNTPRSRGAKCNACQGTGTKTHDPDGIPNHGVCPKCGGSGYTPEHVERNNPAGAPPLDWWNIPPGGFSGAHYAVFPPELCIKPIKAMCPSRVCRVCGEPSRRIVAVDGLGGRDFKAAVTGFNDRDTGLHGPRLPMPTITRTTTDWSDCGHDDWRPGLVLDPFGGSGTTALVATGHGRDCILIDLDERNFDLALQRVGPFILERAK